MIANLNRDTFQEISHILKNSDSDKVKLSEINKTIKQMKKEQEESIDDKREWILKKLNDNPNGIDDKDVISEIKSVINYKLQSADARKLSGNVRDHIKAIQDKSLEGFTNVTLMYKVTFLIGVIMLFFGLALTAYLAINKTPYTEISPYLAIVFGGGGISSMFVSLHQTTQKLQQSRANASQLAMALNEWQFLSLWSGKTYQHMLEKYRKEPSNNISTIETFEHFLQWKGDLTKNMIVYIQKYVANRTDKTKPGESKIEDDKEDTQKQDTQKQDTQKQDIQKQDKEKKSKKKRGTLPKGFQ